MTAASASVQLALTEDPFEPAVAGPWIGPLVALGGLASRFAKKLASDRQLVIAVSVPQRDYAAVLIGGGWVINSAAPDLPSPLETFRRLRPGTPVRVVTHSEVIEDRFRALDETKKVPRVRLAGSQWQASGIVAAAVLDSDVIHPIRAPRPRLGKLGRIARLDASWDARLAAPAADLAIVGTIKWLRDDLVAYLVREHDAIVADPMAVDLLKVKSSGQLGRLNSLGGTLADLLLPTGGKGATRSTRLYSSANFTNDLPLPREMRAVILDGSGAIKYLSEIESQVVICILDRSAADESAADLVVQMRNSRGEPVSLREGFRWRPPAGVEALAFTVAL